MLADFIKDLVGLFNFAETELGETDLDKGSIVKNLVVDWLYSYNLGHLCFKQEFLSFTNVVVQCKMVHLHQSHSHLLSGIAMLVHQANQGSNITGTFVAEVDSWLSYAVATLRLPSLLDLFVDLVILVVNVDQLNNCNTRLVLVLVAVLEKGEQIIAKEQQLIFVLDSLKVLNTRLACVLECFPELIVQAL